MSTTGGSPSRSSATPPASIPVPKKKKTTKDKGKNPSLAQDQGKKEGINPNWDFTPPPGAVLLEPEDIDADEFDWDKINDDDDLELCLIRVPDSVKPKHLENVQLQMPISSLPSQSTSVGVLKRKHTTFDIWSVGDGGDDQPVGGEELKSLSCLLPRKKKKGNLYPAPKPFAHHLLISAQPIVPTPLASSSSADGTQVSIPPGLPYKNPPRQSYPKEVLKHQFMPYGSLVNVTNNSNEMDTDAYEEVAMNLDINVEPLEPQPTFSQKTKKKLGRTVTHSETPIKPSTATEAGPELKKAKGIKRKGESAGTTESPATKKSKRLKT